MISAAHKQVELRRLSSRTEYHHFNRTDEPSSRISRVTGILMSDKFHFDTDEKTSRLAGQKFIDSAA